MPLKNKGALRALTIPVVGIYDSIDKGKTGGEESVLTTRLRAGMSIRGAVINWPALVVVNAESSAKISD
jgi:hypothetical protein